MITHYETRKDSHQTVSKSFDFLNTTFLKWEKLVNKYNKIILSVKMMQKSKIGTVFLQTCFSVFQTTCFLNCPIETELFIFYIQLH